MTAALRNPTPAMEWQGWETEVGKLNSEIQKWMVEAAIDDEETLVGSVEPQLDESGGQSRWISQEEVFCNAVGVELPKLMGQGSGHRSKLKKLFVRAYEHVHGKPVDPQDQAFEEMEPALLGPGERRQGRAGQSNGPCDRRSNAPGSPASRQGRGLVDNRTSDRRGMDDTV